MAYERENIGGKHTLGPRCVRVGRDSGAALDPRLLIGRHIPMVNDTTAFALCLCVYRRLSRFERLIHPSA